MNPTQKLHFITYLVLTVLTLVMAIASVAAAASGSIDMLTGGLAAFVFIVFAILQIACISIYQPALTPYKIGFYCMHLGLLILLSGLAAYELAGSEQTVQIPVDNTGNFYSSIRNENGEEEDLGFAFRINQFRVDKYESGSDKYYRADVEFLDSTTLRQTQDYLEVNRTLRQNGKKIYLMDYSDGIKSLSGQYGLSDQSFYETYASRGESAGEDLLSLIYQDITGVRYAYFLYDEINSRFSPRTAEEIALLTGNLWAYTVESEGYVTVYITLKDGAFTETITDTGANIIAHIENTYPGERVSYSYYTIDQGVVTPLYETGVDNEIENPVSSYEKVFAGIHKTSAGVRVYVMKEELRPQNSFTSTEGGSSLVGAITSVHGAEAAEVSYMLYSPSLGGYAKVDESEIMTLTGEIRGYALNMGDSALIYVHPISVILLIKQDPGEWATLAGMILTMLGGILMCLVRGKRKKAPVGDFDPPAETPSSSKTSVKSSSSAKKNSSAKKSASSNPKPSAQQSNARNRSKGGKK